MRPAEPWVGVLGFLGFWEGSERFVSSLQFKEVRNFRGKSANLVSFSAKVTGFKLHLLSIGHP